MLLNSLACALRCGGGGRVEPTKSHWNHRCDLFALIDLASENFAAATDVDVDEETNSQTEWNKNE